MYKLIAKVDDECVLVIAENEKMPDLWALASDNRVQVDKIQFMKNLLALSDRIGDDIIYDEISNLMYNIVAVSADRLQIEGGELDGDFEHLKQLCEQYQFDDIFGNIVNRKEYAFDTTKSESDQYFKQYNQKYRKQYSIFNSVTMIIIIINIAVFIYNNLFKYYLIQGILSGVNSEPLYGLINIIAAGFTHGNLTHLVFNMLFLYQIGLVIEQLLGKRRFTILYFSGLIASGYAVLFLANPMTLTFGSSGAIFALFGFFVMMMLDSNVSSAAKQSVFSTLALNLLFTFSFDSISIIGHLSGLLFGVVSYYILKNK